MMRIPWYKNVRFHFNFGSKKYFFCLLDLELKMVEIFSIEMAQDVLRFIFGLL